mmetsp:Transcript_38699/g.113199  ORF Transcript_38699/g.113199 Transcript_38699/m.113199 type:complete len:426 (-) Transcript_38699:83-1360(-)
MQLALADKAWGRPRRSLPRVVAARGAAVAGCPARGLCLARGRSARLLSLCARRRAWLRWCTHSPSTKGSPSRGELAPQRERRELLVRREAEDDARPAGRRAIGGALAVRGGLVGIGGRWLHGREAGGGDEDRVGDSNARLRHTLVLGRLCGGLVLERLVERGLGRTEEAVGTAEQLGQPHGVHLAHHHVLVVLPSERCRPQQARKRQEAPLEAHCERRELGVRGRRQPEARAGGEEEGHAARELAGCLLGQQPEHRVRRDRSWAPLGRLGLLALLARRARSRRAVRRLQLQRGALLRVLKELQPQRQEVVEVPVERPVLARREELQLEAEQDEAALVAEGAREDPRAKGRDAALEDAFALQLQVVRVGNLLQRRPVGEVVTQPAALPPAVHAAQPAARQLALRDLPQQLTQRLVPHHLPPKLLLH